MKKKLIRQNLQRYFLVGFLHQHFPVMEAVESLPEAERCGGLPRAYLHLMRRGRDSVSWKMIGPSLNGSIAKWPINMRL
ncbi:hypothetical protein ACFX10_005290 [Malus domestica]